MPSGLICWHFIYSENPKHSVMLPRKAKKADQRHQPVRTQKNRRITKRWRPVQQNSVLYRDEFKAPKKRWELKRQPHPPSYLGWKKLRHAPNSLPSTPCQNHVLTRGYSPLRCSKVTNGMSYVFQKSLSSQAGYRPVILVTGAAASVVQG